MTVGGLEGRPYTGCSYKGYEGSRIRRGLFYLEFGCDRSREDAGFSWAVDCGGRRGVDAGRADEPSHWKTSRGHCLSREEHDVLFSAGYVDFGERGVVSGAVFDRQDAALIGGRH